MRSWAVIQCRYGSSRLPGKALFPLAGVPMVAFLIRRLQEAGLGDRLCLATTTQSDDDAVAAWGESLNIPVVRGERDDVIARYLQCLDQLNASGLVRVTADNPLTDPVAIERSLAALDQGNDYVDALPNWPHGAGVDAFSADFLRRLDKDAATGPAREHLNYLPYEHPENYPAPIIIDGPGRMEHISMTIDTLEEYRMIRALIQDFGPDAYKVAFTDVAQRFGN